ncbi:thiamine phosphate synthase [Shumkonia mesophila]|uniref:thiamine phosphate synthase n=1 Tax=Shumkonia mesophila TaxID=2838854 RepID=UPI002934AAEF|nr:thiamine phosphate synthase [Shumkonia mesophila]
MHDPLPGAGRLPPLILVTDAARLPDPAATIRRLPRGAAVILRHYDAPGRAALARRLAALCRRRGVRLLIAGDWRLAAAVGAGGVHLPEAAARRGPPARGGGGLRRPGFLVTAAAHSPAALWRAAKAGADAALLSPVFPTASHPGAAGIGAIRFVAWCRRSPLPVYALGGIDRHSARRLKGTGAAGFAALGALAGIAGARAGC